jgi:uncharacterized membrane protein
MQLPEHDSVSEGRAKSRFLVISAMRIAGVAMILLGIAVLQRVVTLPEWTGYLLIVLGMAETFLMPQILARLWSTGDRLPPR